MNGRRYPVSRGIVTSLNPDSRPKAWAIGERYAMVSAQQRYPMHGAVHE